MLAKYKGKIVENGVRKLMTRTIRTSELESIVVAGINPRDYPDFSDAYIEEACWKTTGEPLTEKELEMIDESDAYEEIFDQALGI